MLGLSRHAASRLADLDKTDGFDESIDGCPIEAPPQYSVDKTALNLRAQELIKEAAPAFEPAPVVMPPGTTVVPQSDAAVGPHKAVADALKAWSTAWSNRDIPAYLDMYVPQFRPASGIGHDAWIAQRKFVLGRAGRISLNIADVKIVMKDSKKAVTSFRQSYRSTSYQDEVLKTLDWEEVGGIWLISREVTEKTSAR